MVSGHVYFLAKFRPLSETRNCNYLVTKLIYFFLIDTLLLVKLTIIEKCNYLRYGILQTLRRFIVDTKR